MDKKPRPDRASSTDIQRSSSLEITADSRQAGSGGSPGGGKGSWIRSDGAICFDNECITLKPDTDGALDITYDPGKCSCEEANEAIFDALFRAATSGKGVRLEIKPRQEPK